MSVTNGTTMDEDRAALCLAALGNPTRIRLYRLLVRAGERGLNVGDVQRLLAVPASTLAHHVAALVKAGLVDQERRGREVICFANYEAMNRIVGYLTEACCAGVDVGADMEEVDPA
jgi:DNA-binding transcriptional ArsR family regulator